MLGHHYKATYPLGEVTYSSLPALPPRLSKVDVAAPLGSAYALVAAAVLKILSPNDAQPLITKLRFKNDT